MELNYAIGGTVHSSVYQSYERKEIEKSAKVYESSYLTSYVTDIKEIKQPVEFRGELQILLSEASTITVHT